jgi:protein-S-isoprenylcysteine O-methyltransferase Ste14
MYLGLLLILVGIAVLLGNLTPFLVIPVLAWLLQRKFMRVEEAALEATFGEDYVEYKKQVRRWI